MATLPTAPPPVGRSGSTGASGGDTGAGQLTLVVGDDPFLVDRAVADLVAAARQAREEPRDTSPTAGDVRDVPAAQLAPGDLVSLTAPSLFGGHRVVVLRALQDADKQVVDDLTRYTAAPDPDVTLVATHTGGAKGRAALTALTAAGARVVQCPKLTRFADRVEFARTELRRRGRSIDEEALRRLLDAVGSDPADIAAACDQLAADVAGPIDETAVATYYRGRAEVSGFTVADHAVEGHLGAALEQLRWALATGVAPVLITSALAQGLRVLGRLASAPRGTSGATLAAELGIPPWKVDRVRQQLRGWTPGGISRALRVVAETDAQVKGETAHPEYALERAVRRIVACREQR